VIGYLKKLRGALTPEQEILRNRLVMGGASGIGCLLFAFDTVIFSAFFLYLSFNAALYAMQRREIWRPEERWLAAIMLDVTMAFAVMLREPEGMSVFYPIILWMILGNGFRYGVRWLFIAAGLSTIAFGFIVLTTDYWQHNVTLGLGLTLALIVIPAYCSTLIRKISSAKEQAETASKAKSYFLASVSHELRTPLNAIIGYGNHLRQSDMPRHQKDMVEASVLAGEHLLHLIEQLIEVAKTGAGAAPVKTSQFRLTDLLSEIRHIMAVRVEDKGLAINLNAEPLSDRLVAGPADIVRNILLNLVGNAVKFTEAGCISISSGIDLDDEKPAIRLMVSDTGIGIAQSALDHIFQPFQQADDTVMNRFGGTGLGLAICKQLVEQVQGSIQVDSTVGQGTTFHVRIPVTVVEDDLSDDRREMAQAKVIAFGRFEATLLTSAQSQENVMLRHVACNDAAELAAILADLDLDQYDVALIEAHLAQLVDADSPVWKFFADAEIAPVLVSGENEIVWDDVALRASFASILPATPNFAELRSAIRIGCSFGPHHRTTMEQGQPARQSYQPHRILVADDNRTNRNVLGAILGAAGHEVTMVADGDEVLEALETGTFDILLLDVNMPKLSGIDACAMWRQIEGGRTRLPVIGVTADATSDTEQRCLNAGMDMRLTKPVDAQLLLSIVATYCDKGDEPELLAVSDPMNVVVPMSGRATIDRDVIDQEQLDYLLSIGDEAFFRDMVEDFFQDMEDTIDPLRLAVQRHRVQDFRFHAHAIKSSSNNMGAKSLAGLCGHLEKITEGDFDQHRFAYLDKIERELDKVLETLRELTGAPKKQQSVKRV
jgi:two-component system, sensor histidine kinase RpfC